MVAGKTYHIIAGMWRFDSLSISLGRLVIDPASPTHYMPVFEDRQRAEEWAASTFGSYQVFEFKPGDMLTVIPAEVIES